MNLLLATLVFAYFTEVFIDIFSSYKEKLLKSIESKMNVNRYRKFQLVFFLLGLFRKLRINVFFVYLFYLFAVLFFILFIFVPILGQVIGVMKIGLERVPYIVENIRQFIDKFLSGYNVTFDTNYVFGNLGNLVNVVLNAVAKFLGGVLSNLGDWFILILVPLLGLYFINAKKDFIEWLSVNFDNHLVSFFRMFDYYQKVYIRAILVNVLSIVILSSVVFSFFLGVDGVSYGVVYGLFSFIPIVGPILGSLP
ncbi:MAG: hypothetical protein NZM44_04705, partial [Candidatus Calescibacterium sp.]|nr:hypothetical protein [Candidatus Calescibacterium sp.]